MDRKLVTADDPPACADAPLSPPNSHKLTHAAPMHELPRGVAQRVAAAVRCTCQPHFKTLFTAAPASLCVKWLTTHVTVSRFEFPPHEVAGDALAGTEKPRQTGSVLGHLNASSRVLMPCCPRRPRNFARDHISKASAPRLDLRGRMLEPDVGLTLQRRHRYPLIGSKLNPSILIPFVLQAICARLSLKLCLPSENGKLH